MRKRTIRKVLSLINPITHAIEGCAISQDKELNKVRMAELASIDAFALGRATLQEWHDLNTLQSIAETMSMGGVGPEALEACQEAENALLDAAVRFEKTGRMGLTGPGLEAMRELFRWHDLQRTSISRSKYEYWLVKTKARMQNKSAGVRVLNHSVLEAA